MSIAPVSDWLPGTSKATPGLGSCCCGCQSAQNSPLTCRELSHPRIGHGATTVSDVGGATESGVGGRTATST